jgi:hypothetical protein
LVAVKRVRKNPTDNSANGDDGLDSQPYNTTTLNPIGDEDGDEFLVQ